MQPFAIPFVPSNPRFARAVLKPRAALKPRTALITSADRSFRQRLSHVLGSLRWKVREAEGGAQAWSEAENLTPEAMIVDEWLPDLDLGEFMNDFRGRFPGVDLVTTSGSALAESPRGPYRQELLYALRHSQESDGAGSGAPPKPRSEVRAGDVRIADARTAGARSAAERTCAPQTGPAPARPASQPEDRNKTMDASPISSRAAAGASAAEASVRDRLPELVGDAPAMLEISRRVRLVAPRLTPVLIEGPTGSGKELVAEAVHRLSTRSQKPFIAINCAAIPEALLEAELFGHTRGAFTGAVQGRVGRIEAAEGGTLFLDEIGEMPLGLQSKLLRFVECGELQRVGDNEQVKVDVRIVAATHRPLAEHAQSGKFRSDLYFRLAVFLVRTPALKDHAEDLPLLVAHFLEKMGREFPVKRLDDAAMEKLAGHDWPGNVRELEHVLERGMILAGENPVMTVREIDFGLAAN
jgi:DNA-binding NtrC family response regulator